MLEAAEKNRQLRDDAGLFSDFISERPKQLPKFVLRRAFFIADEEKLHYPSSTHFFLSEISHFETKFSKIIFVAQVSRVCFGGNKSWKRICDFFISDVNKSKRKWFILLARGSTTTNTWTC